MSKAFMLTDKIMRRTLYSSFIGRVSDSVTRQNHR